MCLKRKIAVVTLLLGLVGMVAQAPKIEYHEYDLDNGLHVILHEDSSTPNVIVSVLYNVGSKDENPNRTGFAHFFEHLMFEGTHNIGRGEFAKYVNQSGGYLNAYTTSDYTYYYDMVPSNQLEMGLWLESERMMHATVDSVGIKTQKKVVIEEKKQSYDNRPYGSLFAETMKRAFTKHPYRWTTIGDPEHIMAAEDSEFKAFHNKFYVPNNAILVVAGDINIEEAKPLIAKYFEDIKPGEEEIIRSSIVEPPLKGEVRDTIYDNVQLPLVVQAYRTPAYGTDDYYALDMVSTLLSHGESSRLYKTLVDEKQLALQAGLYSLPLKDPGVAITIALPNMGKDCAEVEMAIDKEIAAIREDLITDREMEKLKNQYENLYVSDNVKLTKRAENLAKYHSYFGDANLVNTELDKFLSVTKEDMRRVAQEYLVENNRVVLYYLPKTQSN